MAGATRITVTLPTDQVTEIRKRTDNVSGYVAEAVARRIRHQLLGEELRRYEESHGAFTEAELAAARARIAGRDQPEPVAVVTSDVDDIRRLRGGRVQTIPL